MIQGVQHAAKVRIRVEPFAKGIAPVTVTNALDHGLPSEMLDRGAGRTGKRGAGRRRSWASR